MQNWRYWLVLAAWVMWEIYWGISARGVKRAASKEPLPSRIVVLSALVLSFAFLLVPGWFSAILERPLFRQGGFFFVYGFTIMLAGMGFSIWARQTLGRNWSGRVTIKEDHELVTRGPYRLVRHPIYTGALLAITGSAIALGRYGGSLSVLLVLGVCIYKIRLEERVLGEHFGDKYAVYRRDTFTLIPYIW